jgi:sugar phosphate isomerase/epimerase
MKGRHVNHQPELILCSATLLEDIRRPDSDSIFEQISATRAGGFAGLSLWTLFYQAAIQAGHAAEAVHDAIRESGLRVPMVEAIVPWEAADEASAIAQAEQAFSLAEQVGAEQMVVVTMSPDSLDFDFAVDRFRRICEVGADHGVGSVIEFVPWTGIPDLKTAWQLVEAADHTHGAIMLDTWHWQRQPGGPNLELLRTLPGDKIRVIQLCDSAPGIQGGTMEEALTDRRLPGSGAIDFVSLFDTLDAIGAEPIIAPEVFSVELAQQGAPAMAKRVHDASLKVFTDWSAGRTGSENIQGDK